MAAPLFSSTFNEMLQKFKGVENRDNWLIFRVKYIVKRARIDAFRELLSRDSDVTVTILKGVPSREGPNTSEKPQVRLQHDSTVLTLSLSPFLFMAL